MLVTKFLLKNFKGLKMKDKNKIIEELIDIAKETIEIIYDNPRWDYETSENQDKTNYLNEKLNQIIDDYINNLNN